MRKFIFAHKDVELEGYEVIRNDANPDCDHRMFSEIAGYKILLNRLNSENDPLKLDDTEFISLNHYRRVFDKDAYNRMYVPQPMVLPCTIAQQYQQYHNLDDLIRCGHILKELFPHLVKNFENCINSNIFIPYNMCICTVGQFKDYMNFICPILDKFKPESYEARMEYINANKDKYTGEYKNNDPAYQGRIESFCAERLSTCYWQLIGSQAPVFPARVDLLEQNQTI